MRNAQAHVRFGPEADMCGAVAHGCFASKENNGIERK